MTIQPVTTDHKPPLNTVVDHEGGYGIYKEMRKIRGVPCCILADPYTPGREDPAVPLTRYAVPVEQCRWNATDERLDLTPIALAEFAPTPKGPVINAWVTPGKPEWWQEFEQRLIEATTLEQLRQVKGKTSATRRREVMALWQGDGRYEWLEAKSARSQAENESTTQGRLGD
jgi:hypothetical protein